MAWTIPVTWTAGQIVGASDLNAQIRDNMIYASGTGRPINKVLRQASYSSTSNTFVDIDAVNLIITLTLSGSRVMCVGTLLLFASNVASNYAAVDWILDSTTRSGDATYGAAMAGQNRGDWLTTFVGYFTGLSAASHTFKPQWKAGIATGSASNTDGVAGFVPFVNMWVWEF